MSSETHKKLCVNQHPPDQQRRPAKKNTNESCGIHRNLCWNQPSPHWSSMAVKDGQATNRSKKNPNVSSDICRNLCWKQQALKEHLPDSKTAWHGKTNKLQNCAKKLPNVSSEIPRNLCWKQALKGHLPNSKPAWHVPDMCFNLHLPSRANARLPIGERESYSLARSPLLQPGSADI